LLYVFVLESVPWSRPSRPEPNPKPSRSLETKPINTSKASAVRSLNSHNSKPEVQNDKNKEENRKPGRPAISS
jgi:hypothetical protein